MAAFGALFRCIGEAVMAKGLRALAGAVPFGELVYDVAEDVMGRWRKHGQGAEGKAAVEALVAASAAEVRAAAVLAVEEARASLGPDAPDSQAASTLVVDYLTQIPPALRRSLRRPEDPTGTSVPGYFSIRTVEDVLRWLPASSARFRPGERLAGTGWVLVEMVGAGGFGEVWKAEHPTLKGIPPVALKFCLDPEASATLRHEAAVLDQAMRQGRMPGVVAFRNAYLDMDPVCLEFEYVGGGDLGGVILGYRNLPAAQRSAGALAVMRQLAETVGNFHRLDRPVVHRDLKPSNILVSHLSGPGLDLRVADFGIGGLAARREIRQLSRRATRGEMLLSSLRGAHTPLYASPQQIRGADPDPRDDVHALGVIWYQLLTGDLRHAPAADYAEELRENGVPPEEVALLGRCVASNADRRPADARVLAEQLAALGGTGPVVQPRAELVQAELVVEFGAKGEWYQRRLGDEASGWKQIATTPGLVVQRPGHEYRFVGRFRGNERSVAALGTCKAITGLTDVSLRSCVELKDDALAAIADAKSITALDLGGCKHVTDRGLESVAGLTGLRDLLLPWCSHISDLGIKELASLGSLRRLDLQQCKQLGDEAVTHLAALSRLEILKLNNCDRLTGETLSRLSSLTRLQSLQLNGVRKLKGTHLSALRRLPDLRYLGLGGCSKIRDDICDTLEQMGQLVGLHLIGLKLLSLDGIRRFAPALVNLEHLHLPTHVDNQSIASFRNSSSSLRQINLRCCDRLTDDAAGVLNGFGNLEKIDIGVVKSVTDAFLAGLHLPRLKGIDLDSCESVTDAGVKELRRFPALETVVLWACKRVTDAGIEHLAGLPNLQYVLLDHCEAVTDAGLAALRSCARLRVVRARACSGVTPAGAESLRKALPQCDVSTSNSSGFSLLDYDWLF